MRQPNGSGSGWKRPRLGEARPSAFPARNWQTRPLCERPPTNALCVGFLIVRWDFCTDCGAAGPRQSLDNVVLCDRCADRRIARHTGLAELPEPPGPIVLHGRDGRRHELRVRYWRAPTGIVVELEEAEVAAGAGSRFSVLGAHDADASVLASLAISRAEQEIDRLYLEPASHRDGWALTGDEAAGWFTWDDDHPSGYPYAVVVDGRTLTWKEFGDALSGLEGWRFRLVIEDRLDDARPDGDHEVFEFPGHIIRPAGQANPEE